MANYAYDTSDDIFLHNLVNSSDDQIAHEEYYLNKLTRGKNQLTFPEKVGDEAKNNALADAFVMFVIQYYPNYNWHFFDKNSTFDTAFLEAERQRRGFELKRMFKNAGMKLESDHEIDQIAQSMQFGDIVTNFMIRYRNQHMICAMNQPIIQTASNNCHKKFGEFLEAGFSLQRLAKLSLRR